jgi:formamidopyrimidine-DNA glycosylase
MPELPEVETTCRAIRPALVGARCKQLTIRQSHLRWPIPTELCTELPDQIITHVDRRAKYLIINTSAEKNLIIHLGMSGHLRLYRNTHLPAPGSHDHVDFVFENNTDTISVRYTDPRRFGAILWVNAELASHPLFKHLGPEPLSQNFNPNYLKQQISKSQRPIKNTLMDNHVVVGVGNIYASEALFATGVHPARPSNQLNDTEIDALVLAIKKILNAAIEAGGTTLKDFYSSTGKPGYFRHALQVYGREGQACLKCESPLEKIRLGQRGTVFCPRCQSMRL